MEVLLEALEVPQNEGAELAVNLGKIVGGSLVGAGEVAEMVVKHFLELDQGVALEGGQGLVVGLKGFSESIGVWLVG